MKENLLELYLITLLTTVFFLFWVVMPLKILEWQAEEYNIRGQLFEQALEMLR